jgi:hypothetical protein
VGTHRAEQRQRLSLAACIKRSVPAADRRPDCAPARKSGS